MRVEAMAKNSIRKALTSKKIAPKKGFGAKAAVSEKKQPAELDVDAVENVDIYSLHVRAGEKSPWKYFGRMALAEGGDVGLAMKERRGALRTGASNIVELKMAAKNNLDLLQYGAWKVEDKSDDEEDSEAKKKEPDQEENVVLQDLSGPIVTEMAALYTLGVGNAAPPGSIWSRNASMYGGNTKSLGDKLNAVSNKSKAIGVTSERKGFS